MRETDLAIIGAGVAGLTAATVAAQHGLDVLVIERMGAGGQVMTVERVINFPGFPEGVSGFELGPMLQEQAENAGAQFTLDTVEAIDTSGHGRHVVRCAGESVAARAVLVACGSARRKLGVPGEEQLEGRGVSHCASCDGPLLRGQPVCVVGGGDSAFGEAAILATHASRVSIVFRDPQPHAQRALLDAVTGVPNIELVPNVEVVAITGDKDVTGVRLRTREGSEHAMSAEAVFVYAGLVPDSGFLRDTVERDESGRIVTDAHLRTSVPGIFAAGDVRSGAAYLLAAASGEGAAAAMSALQYLRGQPG